MTDGAAEAKFIAEKIERNLTQAVDTVKLADFLWELRLSTKKLILPVAVEALETIAIQVSGWAQDGHNVGIKETIGVLEEVKKLLVV